MHNKQAGATLQLLTHAGGARLGTQRGWSDTRDSCWGGSAGTGRAQLSFSEWVGGNRDSWDNRGCPSHSAITSLRGRCVERSPALSALIYPLIGKASRAMNISKPAAPPGKVRPLICQGRIPACPPRARSPWDLRPHRRASGKAPTPGFLLQLFCCRIQDPALPAGQTHTGMVG